MVVNATVSSGNKEDDQRLALRSFVLDMAFAKRTTVPNSLIKGSNIGSLDLTPRKGKNVCIISDTTSNVSYTCFADLMKRMLSDHDEKECDCEHCANAVCKTGAYTGTQFIECGLRPDEEYYLNHPDELDWAIKHPE